MGLSATWTIKCDECGKIESVTLVPETKDSKGDPIRHHYFDIWGPGIPYGWIQVPHDKVTDRFYLFFCSRECDDTWLRKQGRNEEADELAKAIWVA